MKEKNPDIIILGKYKNDSTKIKCKCAKCGYEWESTPTHLKGGEGCYICSKKKTADALRKSLEDFIQEMSQIDNTIQIVGEYINYNTKIKCKCLVCGKEWEVTPANLKGGKGCPHCKASKGEKRILEWLDNHNIDYYREYNFNDCRDKKPLPFDFYLQNENICIEYDGIQHFIPTKFSSNTHEEDINANFILNKKHDTIKNEYCAKHNIFLIRISYKDFENIENILEKYLS